MISTGDAQLKSKGQHTRIPLNSVRISQGSNKGQTFAKAGAQIKPKERRIETY